MSVHEDLFYVNECLSCQHMQHHAKVEVFRSNCNLNFLDRKTLQSAIRELRSAIHLHISALEERKRDLLQRIDTIRQTKISTLKAQGERLGQRHIILTEALKVGFL